MTSLHGGLTVSPSGLARVHASSRVMLDVVEQVRRLARSQVNVLFLGETGTGKALLARALHEESHRAHAPFVRVDCRDVHADARDLFDDDAPGAPARAGGGTLFLDEVAELPGPLQQSLLRWLDGRSSFGDMPVGAGEVRVVSASCRAIEAVASSAAFRQDLYFRLAVALVHVPPLRDRVEDLPRLANDLLAELGRPELLLSPETLVLLSAHLWPGNVRELKNALAAALALADGGTLEPRHFRSLGHEGAPSVLERLPLGGQRLEHLERAAIKQTLTQTRGNKVQAARTLGIAPSTLYEKLKRYGL
ncbi:MAG: sigma 54-interacting transcriptional regulator [Myxococcales bacterium]|nr:sigma 54-interacting transcriptional regulator [Myxococcales bacterium]